MPASKTKSKNGAAKLDALLKAHNLTQQEYEWIKQKLGREPNITELGIFSVMWSEHCAYCSSRPLLKLLPTTGTKILVKAGEENAGVVDLGNGLAVAFKVESHNHPSADEPHAGAATGVGGIIRDIFTMGARPIALLNSLRFGSLDAPRVRFLLNGVVRGIADYGNCMGIPTVAGEVAFDPCYTENPLVNVMCIGIVKPSQLAKARSKGVGNPVMYVGSRTGRDGMGGASFASREITVASNEDRPAVQLGDPFTEKCLLEATLEALATGDVVGIQDMGAAGLTCSTSETASRGGCGVDFDVAKVPQRETKMTPYEILLSESQERMLLIVKAGKEERVRQIFAKWDLQATVIGKVTDDGLMRVREQGKVVAEIPVKALTDEAPVYQRPVEMPPTLRELQTLDLKHVPEPRDYNDVLVRLLASPTIADKGWIYHQYDHMVRTNTAALPGRADAAVLRLKGTRRCLATAIDGNGTYTLLDPYLGGQLAVAEAARNVACTGAVPLAVTNCLNFGNPQDPHVMWQFKRAVEGIASACRALHTPVTGGNVSFYNESPQGAVDPTPVIGMIGLIEDSSSLVTTAFKADGDAILLLGETKDELGATEYLKVIHDLKRGRPPLIDLEREAAVQRVVISAARQGWLHSAHDGSEGGLAVAMAESCLADPDRMFGARITEEAVYPARLRRTRRLDTQLFGESASRIIVSCAPSAVTRLTALAQRSGVPCTRLGTVGGKRCAIGSWIDLPLAVLSEAWRTSIPQAMETR
ncbi:MAG: phosphoribosylformylglycinamidine synthase subunit PurL [Candidatus Omnitrophica bacterium]|nr:phosphoribosylformylglycinamidine synthase subunit PurL [Candidatus Omnitrophota bacterium]